MVKKKICEENRVINQAKIKGIQERALFTRASRIPVVNRDIVT